jgi:neutral trehalase
MFFSGAGTVDESDEANPAQQDKKDSAQYKAEQNTTAQDAEPYFWSYERGVYFSYKYRLV